MTPFYPAAQWAFTALLEQHWQQIYGEFLAVQDELTDYAERKLYDEGWHVFGLWNLPHRAPLQGMQHKCPFTYALIEAAIPSHGAAAFSVLQPDTAIKPHTGAPGNFLRCHLGLEVPDGDCAISVGGETRRWTPGKTMVFDDRLEHAAWNRSAARRVVLLLDFVP
jgi:aspartyl/asparaginyl beta-hydroxylase (cupin superfamily)